jgi:hypothetical protein
MFASQTMRDFCGETPEHLVGRIDYKPVAAYFM